MEYHDGMMIANSDLYHHGVLGQKWGVTNGPPYPLNDSEHSAAEKKAGWKKSLASGTKTALKAGGRAAAKGAKAVGGVVAKGAKAGGQVIKNEVTRDVNRAKNRMETRRRIREEIQDRTDAKIYKDKMERKYGKIEKDYYEGKGKSAKEPKEVTLKSVALGSMLPGPFGAAVGGTRAVRYAKQKLGDDSKTSAKQRHNMSDEELDARYNRAKKENELRKIEAENVDAGKAFMVNNGKEIASTVAKTAITGAALYAGKAIISQNFSTSELGDAVFRGGAKKK